MKLTIATLLLCSSSLYAATTVTSNSSNVSPLNSSEANVDTDGTVTFSPSGTNNQGSGFRIDPGAAFNTTVGESTFFNFSAVVGGTTLELFFGSVQDNPASSDGRSSNSTAFSVFLATSGVSTFSNGSPTSLGPTLSLGDVVNFSIEVTNGVQNNNQFIFSYDVEFDVNGAGETFSREDIQANGNAQSLNQVQNYTFNAVGTSTTEHTVGPITISDMPIVSVPEPSASLLAALSLVGLAFIRRRG